MVREVDKRKTRKALNRIRRARLAAEKAIATSQDQDAAAAAQQALSDWEAEFVTSVEQRLEEYGSAFADSTKGSLDEPLSMLQEAKLKEIEKKARGKGPKGFKPRKGLKQGSGFKQKKTSFKSRSHDINADLDPLDENKPDIDDVLKEKEKPAQPSGRPAFRVIDGGKD